MRRRGFRPGAPGRRVEPDANERAGGDADVSATGAAVHTLVVEVREDLEIARQVRAALAGAQGA